MSGLIDPLADVLREAFRITPDGDEWRDLARAAREHIAAEMREDAFYRAIRGDDSGPMLTLSAVLDAAAARIARGGTP